MTTITGLRVARAIYPILLERARAGMTITYGGLVEEAKARHPDDEVIAAVIPRSLGPRLLLLRRFTDEQGYPDLSSLVVNGQTGEVGDAYSDEFDAAEQRALILAFDWEGALPAFDVFIEQRHRETLASKRPRRSREEAKRMLWEFASTSPKAMSPSPKQREAVISMLMDGADLDVAVSGIVAPAA